MHLPGISPLRSPHQFYPNQPHPRTTRPCIPNKKLRSLPSSSPFTLSRISSRHRQDLNSNLAPAEGSSASHHHHQQQYLRTASHPACIRMNQPADRRPTLCKHYTNAPWNLSKQCTHQSNAPRTPPAAPAKGPVETESIWSGGGGACACWSRVLV